MRIDNRDKNDMLKRKIEEKKLSGPTEQVGINEISCLIDYGNMDAAVAEAECWVDRCSVERQLQSSAPNAGQDHNSFDAVGIIKRKTDERDPYYIFRIRNKILDLGCDFVFKSS